MINLFVNFYQDRDESRQQEIREALLCNIKNPRINNVYVVSTPHVDLQDFEKSEKVKWVVHGERPTYAYLFKLANTVVKEADITIISNIDICFDEYGLSLTEYNLQSSVCFALSRWEEQPDGTRVLFNRADSQDAWIFKGPIRPIGDCDFTMGRPGCDNAICHRIEAAGYTVENPSRDIKMMHVHRSGIRNYDPVVPSQVVERPYKLIGPTHLRPLPNWVTGIASLALSPSHSQYGEEVIIDYIFRHIGITNQYLVDLGAGAYGDSTMSNTRKLIQAGWRGYGVDARNNRESWIIERFIKPDNIQLIMEQQNTPEVFDFLNLDIDSCDFWVLKKILEKYSPRCICTEYNGTLDPAASVVLKYEDGYTWDETSKYGYSFAAGGKLLGEHGYRIIYNMLNQNLFSVKKELVDGFFFHVTATQVQYHPFNAHAIWETY